MKALAALVALGGVAAASPCPVYTQHARTLTPMHAQLPAGAGFVVTDAYELDGYSGAPKPAKDFAPTIADWRVDGKPVTAVAIAPGLSVIRGGDKLADKAGTPIADIRRGKDPGALPAPAVTRVRYADSSAGTSRHPWAHSVATITSVPPGALALVVFAADGRDPTTAKSWGVPDPAAHDVYIWASGGCTPAVGTASVTNEHVRFAWLDAGGRLGALSAPVTVQLEKLPP